MSSPPPSSPEVVLSFGRYGVRRLCGRGASGTVYEGYDPKLERSVAIKVIASRLLADPEAGRRLLAEARRIAGLPEHSGIAAVYDAGDCAAGHYIIFQFVPGMTLEEWLRTHGSPSFEESSRIALSVANALTHLHKEGVIHRDVKPANIILGPELAPVLVDFNVGLSVSESAKGATREIQGTPPYLSPEQARGEVRHVNGQTDVWSVGAILYEMLGGAPPFRDRRAVKLAGQRDLTREQLQELRGELRIMHDEREQPLSQLNSSVPKELGAICSKCLSKDLTERYQSAAELAQDLRAWLERAKKLQVSGGPNPEAPTPAVPVSVSHLRATDYRLFGREAELKKLDQAWENSRTHLINVWAWGGMGKSSLVNRWLASMAADHFRDAELVLGWSFDSQADEAHGSSSFQFLSEALALLEIPLPSVRWADAEARQLVKAIRNRRVLLVLDGIDPLQSAPDRGKARIVDPALARIVRECAASNRGLCVVTSRHPVADIQPYLDTTAELMPLDRLSAGAGADVLRSLGVRGSDDDLQQASLELEGHALALVLLGTFLRDVCQGKIERSEMTQLLEHDKAIGGPFQRIMNSYQSWLTPAELSLLRLVGMLELPAGSSQVEELRRTRAVSRVVDPSLTVGGPNWQRMITKLRDARLLQELNSNNGHQIDCHPLVREYFGRQGIDLLLDVIERKHALLADRAVIGALGRSRDPRAVNPLMKALRISSQEGQRVGLRWWHFLPFGWQAGLEHFLRDENQLIQALGEIGDERAVDYLIELVQNKSKCEASSAQMFAAEALGKIGKRSAVMPLLDVLKDRSVPVYVHRQVETALGHLGDARAVDALIDKLAENHRDSSAAAALGEIGDSRAQDILMEALCDESTWGGTPAIVIIRALARLADANVIPTLQKLADYYLPIPQVFVRCSCEELAMAIEDIASRVADSSRRGENG